MLKKIIKYYLLYTLIIFISCENPAESAPPVIVDTTPCGEVTELSAQSGDGRILLNWINPGDIDFNHVLINFSPYVDSTTQPILISKSENTAMITGLLSNIEYIFEIKTVDKEGNISQGISIKATAGGDCPIVQLFTHIGSDTNQTSFDASINFSEIVEDFTIEDITTYNCNVSDLIQVDLTSYNIKIEPIDIGEVYILIPEGKVKDSNNNGNVISNTLKINFDNSDMLVTVNSASDNVRDKSIIFNISFNKETTSLTKSTVSVSNGVCKSLETTDNKNFIATVEALNTGDVILTIPKNSVTDKIGNSNSESSSYTVNYNNVTPIIRITSNISGSVNTSPVPITITSSKWIKSLNTTDFTVINGTITNLQTQDNIIYTADIVPSGTNVSVHLPAGKVEDIAGNLNRVSNIYEFVYDTQNPTVEITSNLSGAVNTSLIPVTITFSEKIKTLGASDFIIENGSIGNLQTGDNTVFTAKITPNGKDVSVSIPQNKVEDIAGNLNEISNKLQFVYDTSRPAVTISSSISSPVASNPVPVTITFSEKIKTLINTDFNIVNGSINNIQSLDNIVYTADILPSGTDVSVSLPENKVEDVAGNLNEASNSFQFIFDNNRPAAVITNVGDTLSQNPQFEFNVTFNESVTGFTEDDLTISNGNIQSFTFVQDHYNIIIVPEAEGEVSITVPENICQDEVGNLNTTSNTAKADYDITPPESLKIFGTVLTENLTPEWNWTGSSDITAYKYRLDSGEWKDCNNLTTVYTAPTSQTIGDHIFELKARDEAGNWTSAESFKTTLFIAKPEMINVENYGTVRNTIYWKSYSTTAKGFILERKESSEGTYEEIKNYNYVYSGNNSDTDYGPLSENTTYYYRIKLYNDMGESEYAEISKTTPFKPVAPSNLKVELLDKGYVSVSWHDNSNNEDGFNIYFGDIKETSINADNTQCNIKYNYYSDKIIDIKVVSFINYGYGYKDESLEAIVSDINLPAIPESPVIVSIDDVDEDKLKVEFRDWAVNETGFEIERRELGGEYSLITTLPESPGKGEYVSYIDETAPGGKILEYRVQSFREIQESPFKLYNGWSGSKEKEASLPVTIDSFSNVYKNELAREGQVVFYRFPAKYSHTYDITVNGHAGDNSLTGNVKYGLSYYYGNASANRRDLVGTVRHRHEIYEYKYFYVFIEGKQATDLGTFSIKVKAYPSISVKHNENTIYDNGDINIGKMAPGTSKTEVFTIENYGDEILRFYSIELTQNGTDFSIAPHSEVKRGTTILPDEKKELLINLSPKSPGPKSVDISFNTNKIDNKDHSFTIEMYGDGDKPKLNVFREDGSEQGHSYFYMMGTEPIGTTISETFTIKNNGNKDLILANTNMVQTSGNVSVDTIGIKKTLAPGETTTFLLTLTITELNMEPIDVTIVSNDPDYSPGFIMKIYGFGSTPEIDVRQGNTSYNNGNVYDFGKKLVNGSQKAVEFTIANSGPIPLNIESLSIDDSTHFTVTQPASSTVEKNGSTTFSIVADPDSVGDLNTTVRIKTNDFNNKELTIPVSAKGVQNTEVKAFGYWYEGELINSYTGLYYSFDAVKGRKYTISWRDRDSSQLHTGDIEVGCKNSDFETEYFTYIDYGSGNPPYFVAERTETLVLHVKINGTNYGNIGTFSIGITEE